MDERLKEAQRKIDRIPAKSPLQENIKDAIQGVLDCVRYLSPNKSDNIAKMEIPKLTKKSKTPVIVPPDSTTKSPLGPDPRDGEGKSELNFDLES